MILELETLEIRSNLVPCEGIWAIFGVRVRLYPTSGV